MDVCLASGRYERMKIRVPKGVTVDGRGFGGRFVSRDQLIALAAATDTKGLRAIQRVADREYRKAAASHQRAADRYVEDPAPRVRERRALAKQQQEEWQRVKDSATDFRETTPEPKKSGRSRPTAGRQADGMGAGRRGDSTRRHRKAGTSPGTSTPKAAEWEIGFKYRAEMWGRRSSDVDINVRVRRVDGRSFGVGEARKVLAHVRTTQETPAAYMVAGVDWKRPHSGTGWRHGSVADMESFWAPMYSRDTDTKAWDLRPQDFRYGAIKGMEGDDGEEN